jgi:Zn-dependent M28 family amino/carboxypeptidase
MRFKPLFAACIVGLGCVSGVCAQTALPPAAAQPSLPPPGVDPVIAQAIAGISAERLRAIDAQLVAFGTRSTFSERAGPHRGVSAARGWIAGAFRAIARRSNGRLSVAFDSYVQAADAERIPRDVEIASVVATLHGDEPGNRTYVMSSHLDSRNSSSSDALKDAPGADDNGSGAAAVLEAARVLAPLSLHATVIFAAFDAEEQGLFGSAHFAQTLKEAGVDVQGDLNNDIVGASAGPNGERNPHTIRIFSEALAAGSDPQRINAVGNENDSPSRELARFVKATGDAYVPDLTGLPIARADRFLRGGDHESFNAAGFAAIRFTEPVENFAHQHQDVRVENGLQYGDLAQYMDFDYLARVARYNAANLAALALGPGRPNDAAILTKELTNATTLSWTPVARATSYEIVRRASTDSDWTAVIPVGDVTTVTVPFSKDDWLFGVRAIDTQGRRSVAAFPLPRRN